MLLAGVPTYYRSFSSPMQVNETARMLATNSRLFQRVVAVRNKMILSGLHAGWHWAAEIDAFGSGARGMVSRSEEHTSELQSLMRISYAVFCLQKKTNKQVIHIDR